MIELMAGGGVMVCAAVLILSRAVREHVRAGWATFKDADTTRSERALVLLGVALLLSGGIIPGPLDELVGIALVARVTRRVAARKGAS